MKKYNITILGWTSWFWEWLVKYIKDNFKPYVDITITWKDINKWKSIADEIWCKFSNDNIQSVKDADIVVFSVPISRTLQVIEEVCPYIKKWALVADVTSVKKLPSEYMEKFASKDVLVIPTHPMFGPYISTIAWQVIVLTANDESQKDQRYKFLKNYLLWQNAKIIETSAQEHDYMMSIVQWLTHFTLFTMWKTMKKLNFDIEFSQNFISPIYKILTASVWRYVWQEPWLYADIQMNNPLIENVHDEFMSVAKEFNKTVLKKDKEWFINMVKSTNEYFGKRSKEWQNYTDKLIHLNSIQIKTVSENIWKKLKFQNIYTKNFIEWIVELFENNNIYLEDWNILNFNERIVC